MQSYGLRTHIWNNQWKSGLLLIGFPLLLALMAFGLALMFNSDHRGLAFSFRAASRQFPQYFAVAMVAAGIWFLIAWKANQAIVDLITGAHPVTREQEPALWNLLETLCISRGITMPRLSIIETQERNAFASGLSLHKGSVTVTRGLMQALTPDELRAVLAHELTHIRNGDSRLAIIAMVFAGIISLVIEFLFRGWRPGRSSDRRGNGAAIAIGAALVFIAYGLAFVLRFALSRNREYLADAGAVELTQDPDAMIAALRRIEGRSAMPEMPGQVRAMFLDDAPAGGWFSGLTATHPSIDARVAALVRQAGGRDPGPLPDQAPEPATPPPWSGEASSPAADTSPWGARTQPAPPGGGASNPWGTGAPAPTPLPVPPGQTGPAAGPWWRGPSRGGNPRG
ncbi:MAG TPA: M48 family metalloprotease [Roseomonas sp.]|jgi:heat shock protein HtpX